MSDTKKDKEEKIIIKVKNAADYQRLKLEKLMKNPEKPVVIPDRPRDKALAAAPDFVRNVMGSSAGAGSGEFHVYRHLRRKEYARQKFIVEKSEREKLDDEYHDKIEQNRRLAEEKTAKKRAKRLKKKKLAKLKGKKPKTDIENNNSSQSDSSEEEEYNNLVKEDQSEDANQSSLDNKDELKTENISQAAQPNPDIDNKDDHKKIEDSDCTIVPTNTNSSDDVNL